MLKNLILLPAPIASNASDGIIHIPSAAHSYFNSIEYFLVENEKTARKIIKLIAPDRIIKNITIIQIPNDLSVDDADHFIESIPSENAAILSESGAPCVADPGSAIVRAAHQKNIRVIPISGPSSIVLALMASGLNGQRFRFLGYLPIEEQLRVKTLHEIEQTSKINNETQIFIETPYRNQKIFKTIMSTLNSSTLLSISVNITGPNEFIKTAPIHAWKKSPYDIPKEPALFMILAP